MTMPAGLLLTHGAGGGADHRLLVALDERLVLPVRRMEFPYRAEGRKAPDRAPKLIASVVEEAARFADDLGCDPTELAFGGRSMGGRICSMAIAEGMPAAAVVLLSYPLHPPGKPEKLRVEHFPSLTRPVLLVQGRKDPFGSAEEFAQHLPAIAGQVSETWVDGGHDPRPSRDDEIVSAVAGWLGGAPSARR